MLHFILLILSVFCLCGCTTPQQRAAAEQARMDRMIGEFGPACYQLGYPANSDQWRSCVVQLAEPVEGRAALHGDTGLPTVFVHDGHPGGAGFAERDAL